MDIGFLKTTWNDVTAGLVDDTIERRQITLRRVGLERPSSVIWYIECPFCNSDVKAYLWSLSGGGKRCDDCGAILGTGEGFRRKPKSEGN
jgi:hypothetical protein